MSAKTERKRHATAVQGPGHSGAERRTDARYMARALALARRAMGRTSPNPLVGAVVVRGGHIVGEGFHERAGHPHAEAVALGAAGEAARGATLYVNLEPCAHFGRTPPCADAIAAAGVRRVVAACGDPNPLVAGRGFARLRAAGVAVTEGVLAEEARALNEPFFHYVTTGRPFFLLKAAMTLDGKIATAAGRSRWITGEEARAEVHRLRAGLDAVLVGVGTVLADDPLLTARLPGGRDPVRVVADSRLRLPVTARVLNPDSPAPLWVATTEAGWRARGRSLLAAARRRGAACEILVLPAREGRVDLEALAEELARRQVTSVLVEAGATLNAALLAAGLVQKVAFFLAPTIVGGEAAPGPVGGPGVAELTSSWRLDGVRVRPVGSDLLVTGYVRGRAAAGATLAPDGAGEGGPACSRA